MILWLPAVFSRQPSVSKNFFDTLSPVFYFKKVQKTA